MEIGEHALDHQLRGAIGIDRGLRQRLVDRNPVGNAVGGAGARQHELIDAVISQGLEQRQRADDIVAIVLSGVRDRLANVGERRKVQAGARTILLDSPVESGPIEDVALFERSPFGGPIVSRRQIVENNGLIPFLRQDLAGVLADIARASSNQNVFRDSVIHLTLATEATSGSPLLSNQDFLSLKYSHRSAHEVPIRRPKSQGISQSSSVR
jgi:hypothetical protein